MKRLSSLFSLVALLSALPGDASACGLFPREDGKYPALEAEQVLLIYDEATRVEHFIREVSFNRASSPFGFVIPTPGKPTVHATKKPFQALAERFRFITPKGKGFSHGYGGGGGVQVLSTQRVGSFTVAVVSATDGGALDAWLKQNGFTSAKSSRAWLEGYVRQRFYFAAFRYEPIDKSGGNLVSETIDVSFSSAAPYYPYREPDRPVDPDEQRIVALWLISRSPFQPVAAAQDGPQVLWKRPFLEGVRPEPAPRDSLLQSFPGLASALPPGDAPLSVQAFQDQKTSRIGYGDVIFVPETRRELSQEDFEAMRPLFAALDPSLEPSP